MHWMSNRQTTVAQHQPLAVELLAEKTVMPTIAMGGIAHDRVRDVSQMATKLMLAPGMRQQAHQTVTTGWMAGGYGMGKFNRLQAL